MSNPQDIPNRKPRSPGASPARSPSGQFLIPSPLPTKRTRTYSASERALAGPTHYGRVQSFCREKGHGFILPREGGDHIFVHISDIEGDFVPKEGDEVRYKTSSIPPKYEKMCAVHVAITHPAEGVTHETWETPVQHGSKKS